MRNTQSTRTAVRTLPNPAARRIAARVRCAERRSANCCPKSALADAPPPLPELAEPDVVRHFTNLSTANMSVDTHFYPLGSCTMKYNPKRNERLAALPGLADLHPLSAGSDAARACCSCSSSCSSILAEISGLDAVLAAAGRRRAGRTDRALVAAAYFRDRGENRDARARSRQCPRHQSGQRRHGRVSMRSRSRATPTASSIWTISKPKLDDADRRVHDHQSEHARPVRERRSTRSPSWCTTTAGSSISTART